MEIPNRYSFFGLTSPSNSNASTPGTDARRPAASRKSRSSSDPSAWRSVKETVWRIRAGSMPGEYCVCPADRASDVLSTERRGPPQLVRDGAICETPRDYGHGAHAAPHDREPGLPDV